MEIFGVRLRRHERFQLDGVSDDTSSDEGHGSDAEDPERRSLWNWQHVDGHGTGSRRRHKAHKKPRLRVLCQGAVDLVKRNKGFVIVVALLSYYVFGMFSGARLPDIRQPANEKRRSDSELIPRDGSFSAGENSYKFVAPPLPPGSADVETDLHQNGRQKAEGEQKPDQQEKKPSQNGQPPAVHPEVEDRNRDHTHKHNHGHAPDLLRGLKLTGSLAESGGDIIQSPFSKEDTGL
uniref:Uncharacterized protein n=1 Tax=Rhodosorus marinus TaxID=101924 RepID=A0A7S0BJS7_9RHOD|mmetsp:Transcript_17440/g.25034  ORF Transcript_17440/g.25034 Transcript_17440/m.25034 type:complete len:235 (+) Transcript_17440:259-963(+)